MATTGESEDRRRPDESPTPARLVSFSDGVLAIAITLLAFQLPVPEISDARSAPQLSAALGGQLGHFRIFLITFAVIGYYWIIHHRLFRTITGHDSYLTVANLVFLLGVSVLPFGANLYGRYSSNTTAFMVYAGILALVGLSFLAMSLVADVNSLFGPHVAKSNIRRGEARSLVASVVFLASVALAPVIGAGNGPTVWIAIPVVFVGVSRLIPGA